MSSVLQAMHVPPEYARGTIRFSLGRTTTAEVVDESIDVVEEAVRRLRRAM